MVKKNVPKYFLMIYMSSFFNNYFNFDTVNKRIKENIKGYQKPKVMFFII